MKSMKALVYDKPGRMNSGIRDIDYPTCGDDEIIIRVMSASICKGVEHSHDQENVGTDLAKYPVVPGHEFAGFVEEIGKNVEGFKNGDRVTADNTEYCDDCYYCRKEESNYCPVFGSLGHNINGGFAEYVRVKKEKVFHIPDRLSFNAASLAEPTACCIHCLDRCQIKFGEDVVVLGAGPNGLIMAQLLKHSGARQVAMIASTQSKLDIAEKCGVSTILMDRDDYSVHEAGLKAIMPMGADCIVDCTGSVKLVENSIMHLKKGGRLVQFAVVHSREPLKFDSRIMFNNELTFTTSFCQSHEFGRSIAALSDGSVNGDLLISAQYDFDDYYEALDYNVNNRDAIKVVVHPNIIGK